MKASTYQRRHTGAVADKILRSLAVYHKCYLHNEPGCVGCLADMVRTDLIMDIIVLEDEEENDGEDD